MKQLKRTILTLVALIALTTQAWGMQVFISYPSWPTGTTSVNGDGNLVLEMEPSDSFDNMRAKIQDKTGFNPMYMHLYYNSVEMMEDETLNEKGVTSNSVLTLVYNDPASSGTPVALTRGTGDKANEWTFDDGMPAGNVTVNVEYWPGMLTLPAASESGTVAVEGLINNKIMNENFDDYTAGGKLAQTANAAGNSYWTTWSNAPGGNDDGTLATLNDNTCLKVNESTDQVLQLGDQTSGMWEYSLDVYVPDGNIGYFNLLHNFGGTNIWAFDCYLNGTYNGSTYSYAPGHGTVNAGTKMKADLPCVHDEWMHVSIVIDIDNDLAKLYFNGQFICEWQWSLNVYAESVYGGKLAASDFYGVGGDFYVDNITFTQISDLPAGFERDDDGNIYVESGTQFTLVTTPAENYHLASLSDGTNTYDVDDEGKVTITMPDADLTLTAEFAENTYTVEFAEGTDPNEWTADPNTDVKKGDTVTVTYTGSKKVIGVKAEKKSSAPTLKDALADGATVVINYTWKGSYVTTFTFTNNAGTFTGNVTGTEAEYFVNGMSIDGTTLKFTASNADYSDAYVDIRFYTDTNEYYFADKGSRFTSFTISVNGTDLTDQLSELK